MVVLQKPVAGRTCRDLWRWMIDKRFLYVADLVEAILLADRIEPAGEVLQIASGKETSIRSLLHAMKAILPTLKFDVRFAPARPGELCANYASIERRGACWGSIQKLSSTKD